MSEEPNATKQLQFDRLEYEEPKVYVFNLQDYIVTFDDITIKKIIDDFFNHIKDFK